MSALNPVPQRSAPKLLCLMAAAAAAALLLAWADGAEATHTRGGSLMWEPIEQTPTGWVVQFDGTLAWQWPMTQTIFPATAQVGTVAACMTLLTGQGASVLFCQEVIHIDYLENWLLAKIVHPDCQPSRGHSSNGPNCQDGVLKEYNTLTTGTFTASHSICCRISTGSGHVNNPDNNQRIETRVQLPLVGSLDPAVGSAKIFIPPITDCDYNSPCTIYISQANVTGYSWATTAQSGLGNNPPGGPPHSTFIASVDPVLHEVNWDTQDATDLGHCQSLYSAQLLAERSAAHAAMDWFIRLCPGDPPHWVVPPSECGNTLQWRAGVSSSHTVRAAHNNPISQVNMLLDPWTPLPPGATQTMPAAPGNPVQGTMTWTPDLTHTGNTYTVKYHAYTGNRYAPICTIHIEVYNPLPVPMFHCSHPTQPYKRVHFTDQSSHQDASAGLVLWEWDLGDGTLHTTTTQGAVFHHDYAQKGWYTVSLTLWDDVGNDITYTQQCWAEENFQARLDPIGDRNVYETYPLEFMVTGSDPEGDPTTLTWNRGPLYHAAAFRIHGPTAGTFDWTPHAGAAGEYWPVTFTLYESRPYLTRSDTEQITVTVLPLNPPPPPAPPSDTSGDGVPDHLSDCPSCGPSAGGDGDAGDADGTVGGTGDGTGGPGAQGADGGGPAAGDGSVDGIGWLGDGSPEGGGDGTRSGSPCVLGDADVGLPPVVARPAPDGTVHVAWAFEAGCSLDGFQVWKGEGNTLVRSIMFEPGRDTYRVTDPSPWTDRAYVYTVQAVVPGQASGYDPVRAAASNPVDLRSCNGLEAALRSACLEGLAVAVGPLPDEEGFDPQGVGAGGAEGGQRMMQEGSAVLGRALLWVAVAAVLVVGAVGTAAWILARRRTAAKGA